MTISSENDDAERQRERFARVRFVLVGTTHPGNIGASARAMKAMGFSDLQLVSPKRFPSAEATARASGADDLLAHASVVTSLAEAVTDCALVIGTTARDRHLEWPVLSPRDAAARVIEVLGDGPVAVVFGREQSGLSNAELDRCQHAIRIPTNPAFNSLNLAQAVQVCAYELRQALLGAGERDVAGDDVALDPLADAGELDRLHQHLIAVMTAVGYFDPTNPRLLPRRLRRLLNRSEMQRSEVQILRGFLSAVERHGSGS